MENPVDLLIEGFINNEDKDYLGTCLIEEMSELTKVLTKRLRGKMSINHLEEELAHVILMTRAVKEKFEIDDSILEYHQVDALNRYIDDSILEYHQVDALNRYISDKNRGKNIAYNEI